MDDAEEEDSDDGNCLAKTGLGVANMFERSTLNAGIGTDCEDDIDEERLLDIPGTSRKLRLPLDMRRERGGPGGGMLLLKFPKDWDRAVRPCAPEQQDERSPDVAKLKPLEVLIGSL